jgi:hypothetical protein
MFHLKKKTLYFIMAIYFFFSQTLKIFIILLKHEIHIVPNV